MFEASGRRNKSFDVKSRVAEAESVQENGTSLTPSLTAVRARLDHLLIGVARGLEFDLQRGNLVLRGKVTSFYHKQLAQEAVKKIEGVRQVTNCIEVAP